MSLLFNMLSRLVINFLPRSKRLLISSLQSPSAVILEPKKIKSLTVSIIFPGDSGGKASAYNAGDPGSIPGYGRSPGERNGKPLQYSCLENPMDGGAWWPTVHGVSKSQTQLNDFTFTFTSTSLFPCFPIYLP